MSAELHYIYDPLCGWCYGAEPLVRAAHDVEGLGLVLHGGGLWPAPTRLPRETREYIRQADARVGAMSGQPYGEAYLSGLLFDPELVLESRPTIAAVLAAEALDPARALPMLAAIQHGHYERGLHVVRQATLLALARELGFAEPEFLAAMESAPVEHHVAATRRLMARIGAAGFPAFALEIDGRLAPVAHHGFASDPGAFARWLAAQLPAAA